MEPGVAGAFDPYYRWLGIPPKDQPPNHYRLLSLEQFEANPGVIEAAADRQMGHLRTYQAGPHSDLSQKLLNEVASAKVCLLNPAKKAEYNAQLREQLPTTGPAIPPPIDPDLADAIHRAAAPGAGRVPRALRRRSFAAVLAAAFTLGGAILLVAVALLVRRGGESEEAASGGGKTKAVPASEDPSEKSVPPFDIVPDVSPAHDRKTASNAPVAPPGEPEPVWPKDMATPPEPKPSPGAVENTPPSPPPEPAASPAKQQLPSEDDQQRPPTGHGGLRRAVEVGQDFGGTAGAGRQAAYACGRD